MVRILHSVPEWWKDRRCYTLSPHETDSAPQRISESERVGIGFMVKVPENVMVKDAGDRFEEGGYFFGYRVGERVEVLINWWGSSSLEPMEKYLFESTEFSQRMWTSGDKWGHEYRGTLPNGKIWRRIALKNGAITYQENLKEAAKVFDSMLDTMCFDESAVKW